MKLKGKIVSICMAALIIAIMATTIAFAASDDTETDESAAAAVTAGDTEQTTPADDSANPSGGRSRPAEHKNGTHVNVISVAASVLGKTTDEVKESIRDAKVGDLLIAAGKVDEFKTAYLAEAKTKLDEAVASGTLTQAEADEKYAEAEAKMAAYDGTTHLCGGTDHSKMFGRDKPSKG